MAAMKTNRLTIVARVTCAAFAAFASLACDSGSAANWTFAPLGPTPAPGSSAAATPAGTPAGTAIEVATNSDNPLAFVPSTLDAPANTLVTLIYNNNSTLEHNIDFFNGTDATAPSLGATDRVTGPNAPRSVTFTTPTTPGDYYFWCDVHLTAMQGTLHVQ
jgi:plastocyanin